MEIDDIARLTAEAYVLQRRIARRVKQIAPNLLALPGVGALTAARIVGETALVSRFGGRESAFARFAGVAPVPRWSGAPAGRMRYAKHGNRLLNSALHRPAVTQMRYLDSPGKAYHDKRIAQGYAPPMALRCLKRRICRSVCARLNTDNRLRHPTGAAPGLVGSEKPRYRLLDHLAGGLFPPESDVRCLRNSDDSRTDRRLRSEHRGNGRTPSRARARASVISNVVHIRPYVTLVWMYRHWRLTVATTTPARS